MLIRGDVFLKNNDNMIIRAKKSCIYMTACQDERCFDYPFLEITDGKVLYAWIASQNDAVGILSINTFYNEEVCQCKCIVFRHRIFSKHGL